MLIPQVRRFLQAEQATTSVEYAVMLALILMVIFSAITGVGSITSQWWQSDVDRITSGMAGS